MSSATVTAIRCAWHDAASKGEGAWRWYGGDAETGKVYGKLYNWFAVNDPRGLAPAGWHVPTDGEWERLVLALGGDTVAGRALKKASSRDVAAGSATGGGSGFNALPAGSRNCLGGFFAQGSDAFFWSSTSSGEFEAWNREIGSRYAGVRRVSVNKSIGFSVRCLMD